MIINDPYPRGLDALSVAQLQRLYNKAYRRMDTSCGGYDPFGWDWHTLRIARPGWYRTLRGIQAALNMAILKWHWEHGTRYAEYDPRNTEGGGR